MLTEGTGTPCAAPRAASPRQATLNVVGSVMDSSKFDYSVIFSEAKEDKG